MTSSFRKAITVYTRPVPTLTNGFWAEGGYPTASVIYASLQPASGKDLQSLPDGRRSAGGFVLITDSALNLLSNNPASPLNPDFIIINGDQYEVVVLAAWQNNVINHFQYILQKTENPVALGDKK